MTILFAAPNWEKYKKYFELSFTAFGLNYRDIITSVNTNENDIEFIIYSPASSLCDFSKFRNLKAVLNLWAGVDEVVNNQTLKRPLVRLIDEGLRQGMVEWCLAHVLRHHLSIDTHIKAQDGVWRSDFVAPLASNRNIGILGLGELGTSVAKSLAGIGFNVFGWSQTQKNFKAVKSFYGQIGLEKVLQVSEILILLLPLTPRTRFLINAKTLANMPRGSTLINPGRGLLIRDHDLLTFLDNNHLKHATLDVFAIEPLPREHRYWSHPKVTVTPHIAAATRPASTATSITKSIMDIRNGKTPIGLVNRSKFY